MIRVTIELWPRGSKDKAKHLGTIDIINTGSGTPTLGNYIARLSRRGSPNTTWRACEIEGFPRKRLGAYDLLLWVLAVAVRNRAEKGE